MRDSASWKSSNHSAFVNLQVYPSGRLELFANTTFNSGKGEVSGLLFDPTVLPRQPSGLNFTLQSTSFGGFSDLDLRHTVQSVGLNYRLRDNVVFNSVLQYNDMEDSQPYLFDATGRRVSFLAGVNWLF